MGKGCGEKVKGVEHATAWKKSYLSDKERTAFGILWRLYAFITFQVFVKNEQMNSRIIHHVTDTKYNNELFSVLKKFWNLSKWGHHYWEDLCKSKQSTRKCLSLPLFFILSCNGDLNKTWFIAIIIYQFIMQNSHWFPSQSSI